MDIDAFLSATPEPGDPSQKEAVEFFAEFFDTNRQAVFFSRQLEVRHEDRWYHWVTNRALRELIERRVIRNEVRRLKTGGTVHLMWDRRHRYSRRDASRTVSLIEQYADPNIGGAIGLHGELMVLEGFARRQFVMRGRNTRVFRNSEWDYTDHELDFIFERDGIAYGVEVKNTLGIWNTMSCQSS